jgi:alkyl hydroperoxide reductase subunit AhpC
MSCGKVKINKPAPDFKAVAYYKGIKKISLSDYKGKYLLLFFYPFDFTFVCPTEICEFSDNADKFRANNCEVVGASIDSHFVHMQWTKKPRSEGGLGEMKIPLLADVDHSISTDYGCNIEDGENKGAAWRATYIIDTKGLVRHFSVNDLPVGRNVEEYVRLVQAFQYADEHGEVCPSQWKPGAATISPGDETKLNKYWSEVHGKK